MEKKLIALTDRQVRLLPILAAHYRLHSSTGAVRAAVDAMLETCAERDPVFRSAVEMSDAIATADESPRVPSRVKVAA